MTIARNVKHDHWRRVLRTNGTGTTGGSFIDMGQIDSPGVAASTGLSPWVVTLDFGEGFKLTLQRG